MSMVLIPWLTRGITASALALWGRAENTTSTLPCSSEVIVRSSPDRWGNTAPNFSPAALLPVTVVIDISGC